MNAKEKVDEAVKVVRSFEPDFSIEPKAGNRLHRAIGWLLGKLGNPNYNDHFWTTLGPTAYYPSDAFEGHDWMTVLHEGRHAIQSKDWGRWTVAFAYLFPQVLAAAVLLLLCVPGVSWWFALGLLVLAPLPAVGRAFIEYQAYSVSMSVMFWYGDIPTISIQSAYIDEWLVRSFCGPNYYWMWPFKGMVRKAFGELMFDLRHDMIAMTPYLKACRDFADRMRAEDSI